MRSFENKVVVITGALGGIGSAAVRRFAENGAWVYAWDRLIEETNVNREEKGTVVYQSVDVTNADAVADGVSVLFASHKRIDVLINNAGIVRDSSFVKMSKVQWDAVIDVNLTGVFNTCKAVIPIMRDAMFGRIINTSSVIGLYGNFGQTNYAAAKAGLIGFTKSLARELGPKGITVNAVAPGFIETDMVKSIPQHVMKSLIERTPVGRLGRPEEVAELYCFLASTEAAFINGAAISIDGGFVG